MDRKTFIRRSSKAMLGTAVMNSLSYFYEAVPLGGSAIKSNSPLTLFLAGDVMTGRGVDQVLPYSVDSRLHERYVKNARQYVQLAEQKNGSIPDEVSYRYIWGEALDVLEQHNPDVRIINLETSVTTSEDYQEGKGVHYRMHPENTALFTEADIDVCVLANNHLLDWGEKGLKETLKSLRAAGLKTAGAGTERKSAEEPAVVETANGRLLVFSYGSPSAGVPMSWNAGADRPGVNVLPRLNSKYAEKVASQISNYRQEEDLVILSLHWGDNWGYDIPKSQQEFAHRVIDEGAADMVHGHSSHHPKGIEIHSGKLILYGCGDLINDYEGISRHKQYRGDLSLMYFPQLDRSGDLVSLEMTPMQIRHFQLRRAPDEAQAWIHDILDRECERFGHVVEKSPDGYLMLRWH